MDNSEGKRLPSYTALMSVFAIVSLNLLGAWILKKATRFDFISLAAIFFIGLVIVISVARFVLWAWLHKRVDLSKSYPLTAIFYPLIALVSIIEGEVIQPTQWAGIFLITLGIIWFSLFVENSQS